MPDQIPPADPDFNDYAQTFVTYAVANGAALGLTPTQTAALSSLHGVWNTAFPAHNTAQLMAKSATAAKETARVNLEIMLREIIQFEQNRTATTDAQRQALGITPRDTTRTATPDITSRPIIKVDTSQRLRHTIRVMDESTPTSRKRPAAAMGFELWCKVGNTPPTGIGECEFLGLIVRSPNVEEFEPGDANQLVHYIARWQNKVGKPGPISETVSATVGA